MLGKYPLRFSKPWKTLLLGCLAGMVILTSVQANTLEQMAAQRFVKSYTQNEARLQSITNTLAHLPLPYRGEPTATGGFLSFWLDTPEEEVRLNFNWPQSVKFDAIGLLPLRLYLPNHDTVTDNAYWPGLIKINALIEGVWVPIAELKNRQRTIRHSLPELIKFKTIETDQLQIVCTHLRKETTTPHYGAGFAEVFIFSDQANLAPQATLATSKAREDKAVFSAAYLTDEQTPLGLPELGPATQTGLGIFFPTAQRVPNKPYQCEIAFEKPTLLDAVRLDPAIIHKAGQGFPVRFSIELLNSNGQVIQASDIFKHQPLYNPGLNPYTARFKATMVYAVRLIVYEIPKPSLQSNAILQLSEITPLFQGIPILEPATFLNSTKTLPRQSQRFEPSDERLFWTLESVYDGMTQAGKVISHRDWIEGLSQRQLLLEDQVALRIEQEHILLAVHKIILWGLSLFTVFILSLATFIVIRNRTRSRTEIRLARSKIASDLHDDVGSNLGAIVLHTEKLQEIAHDEKAQKRLLSILRLTRESVFGLREVLHTTAPEVGRVQDIIAYMHELAGLLLGQTHCTFEAEPSLNQILQDTPPLRKGLLLFFKEALSNAKTHSQCNHVDISFTRKNSSLVLRIKDDGKGIDEQTLNKPRTLRTLKQRAEWLQADLEIESTLGTGTVLTLSIPKE